MKKRRKRKASDEPEAVRRDGGLSAHFVNTANRQRRSIETYGDLVAWGRAAGILSAAAGRRLEKLAAERPAETETALGQALTLRIWLERVFSTLEAGQALPPADLDLLNRELAPVLAQRRLVAAAGGGYRWTWDEGDDAPDRMLGPLLLSVADLLATPFHRKVRRCAGEGCGLFFVDRTPGSPRKWCSMKACGSRVGSRRHYHRTAKPERRRSQERAKPFRVRATGSGGGP